MELVKIFSKIPWFLEENSLDGANLLLDGPYGFCF
jgi:hypothetical protein